MQQENTPIINTDRLSEIVSVYKFPFIFGFIGLVLLVAAVVILVKNRTTSGDVVFKSSEASPSAIYKKIYIDIAGAVMKPGVYELREGERISDVLSVSGGLSATADREWVSKNLNRAAKLIDGGKVYIPEVPSHGLGPAEAGKQNLSDLGDSSNLLGITTGKVNINSASQKELEDLPGIGPVIAGKIINGRQYQTVEELKTKKVVGVKLFDKLKDLIVAF